MLQDSRQESPLHNFQSLMSLNETAQNSWIRSCTDEQKVISSSIELKLLEKKSTPGAPLSGKEMSGIWMAIGHG
uniref:Uncharacterized protein n=1 Tax=Arundo donax TaxID=35708 RepID=A0A0A9FWT1_ARUDO